MWGKALRQGDIFITAPPDGVSGRELFLWAWSMGAGRERSREGLPVPWTAEALEAAFAEAGREVSLRTVENWRAGATVPNRRNRLVLAGLFAGRDRAVEAAWMEGLAGRPWTAPAEVETPSEAEPETAADIVAETDASARKPRVGPAVAAALLLAGGVWLWRAADTAPTVTELRVCAPEDFDKATLRCPAHQDVFAAGTREVRVSFEASPPEGTPFERRWYRDGRMFLLRDGFFDAAWENWTWLRNPDGHDPGTYHLRIVVDGEVATAEFEVEALD